VLDFGEFVVFEVVHRVTDDVVRVDAADLVDEDPGLDSGEPLLGCTITDSPRIGSRRSWTWVGVGLRLDREV